MKKILTGVLAIVATVILSVVCAACSSGSTGKVAGNTYTFDTIKISYSSEISAADKAGYEAQVADAKIRFEGATISFDTDGKVESDALDISGYYKQDGDKIYGGYKDSDESEVEYDNEPFATVSGNKVYLTETITEGVTAKIVFKK